MNKFAFKLLLILMVSIIPVDFAFCEENPPAFPLDLKQFEVLKNNPHVSTYKIYKLNNNTAKVVGKLKNGDPLEIQQSAGDTWNIKYQTIVSSSSEHPLSDNKYWLNQALIFAKQIWDPKQFLELQKDMNNHRFVLQRGVKNKQLFEKYAEGNYQSIAISQSGKKFIIELQKSAC